MLARPSDRPLSRGRLLGLNLLALLVSSMVGVRSAHARPTAPAILCKDKQWSDAPECAGKLVSCTLCHESIDPPSWNAFGTDIQRSLDRGKSFEEGLVPALQAVSDSDSDGDGVDNAAELSAGTAPGDMLSVIDPDAPESPAPYDLAFAFRRVLTLYCGQSPSYGELKEFRAAARDEQAGKERLHAALDRCLDSDYWQKDALLRLADKRIKPQASLGPDTQLRLGKRRVVLGDYWFDYRLWRFIMTGDRDMRELLTADYHVLEKQDGTLEQTREELPRKNPDDLAGGQPLDPQHRAGMITTQWFIHSNTMVSALPRTTAAQAYRAYLGADISAMEGLMPVAGEPADVDHKGVKQARCARCHSTLDPLAYAYAKYEGAPSGMRKQSSTSEPPRGQSGSMQMPQMSQTPQMPTGQYDILANIGGYNADRPKQRIPDWEDDKQTPYVLGQRVDDLVGLAKVAVASDEFKRNLAEMFFRHALGADASSVQQAELNALWRSLPDDGYSANRLIHRLVDTRSFGAP